MAGARKMDYLLYGDDMQFVEIELNRSEGVLAEAGAMMYMDDKVQMETIFGDGSNKGHGKGFMGKLIGAGKRAVTGEGIFMTLFTNRGESKAHVAFAAPYPGKIISANLADYNGCLICQKDAFLCAAKGISIDIHIQKKIGVGFFGGEGFIMQKIEGDGMAFLHAGGTIIKKELQAGEILKLDTGCLVAMTSGINYDVQFAGDIKTGIFGGEGLFLATLQGPGLVWLQSLPFSRMADRIYSAAKSGHKGETKGLNNPLEELAGIANLLGRD
ncbi:TIGR00266 family protein [Fusibacter ferrireducens]|uniref:TIGR00266 family protein n=1 Tax=Fusibacter ferrireducens TaxID=2785058 RepID=A0ABR9ZTA5_9FIRM|nr:TIGR00266 family protein [Fusibacter ferrireducens]MBF4693714.1 TIGR00266 family protein [Fusibacter ferrireducens]